MPVVSVWLLGSAHKLDNHVIAYASNLLTHEWLYSVIQLECLAMALCSAIICGDAIQNSDRHLSLQRLLDEKVEGCSAIGS